MKILENLLEIKQFPYKYIDSLEIQSEFSQLLFSSPRVFLQILQKSQQFLHITHDYSQIIKLLNRIDEILSVISQQMLQKHNKSLNNHIEENPLIADGTSYIKQDNSSLNSVLQNPLINGIESKLIFEENEIEKALEILLSTSFNLLKKRFVHVIYNSFDRLLEIIRLSDKITIIHKIVKILILFLSDEKTSINEENPHILRYLEELFFIIKFFFLNFFNFTKELPINTCSNLIKNCKIQRKDEIFLRNGPDFLFLSYDVLEKKYINSEKTPLFLNDKPFILKNLINSSEKSSLRLTEEFFLTFYPEIPKNSPIFDDFLCIMKLQINVNEFSEFFYLFLDCSIAQILFIRLFKKENSSIFSYLSLENSNFLSFDPEKLFSDLFDLIFSENLPQKTLNFIIKTLKKLFKISEKPYQNSKETAQILKIIFHSQKTSFLHIEFLFDFLEILKGKLSFFLNSFEKPTPETAFSLAELTSNFIELFTNSFVSENSIILSKFPLKILKKMAEILSLFLANELFLEEFDLETLLLEKITLCFDAYPNSIKIIGLKTEEKPLELRDFLLKLLEILSNFYKEKHRNPLNYSCKKLLDSQLFFSLQKVLSLNAKDPFLNKILAIFLKFIINVLESDSNPGSLLLFLEERGLIAYFWEKPSIFSEEEPAEELFLGLFTLKLAKALVKYENTSVFLKRIFELFDKFLMFFLRDDLIVVIYSELIEQKFESPCMDFAKEFIEILELKNEFIEKDAFIKLLERFLEILLNFEEELPEKLAVLGLKEKEIILEQFKKLLLNSTVFFARVFGLKSSFREKLFENLYKKLILLLRFRELFHFDKISQEILLKCYEPMLQLSKEFIYDLGHYNNDLLELLSQELNEFELLNKEDLLNRAFFVKALCFFLLKGFHQNLVLQNKIEAVSLRILAFYRLFLCEKGFEEYENLLDLFMFVLKGQKMAFGKKIKKKMELLKFFVEIMVKLLEEFERNCEKTEFLKGFVHLVRKIKSVFVRTMIPEEFLCLFEKKKGFEKLLNILEREFLTISKKKAENCNLEQIFYALNSLFFLPIELETADSQSVFYVYFNCFQRLSEFYTNFCSGSSFEFIKDFLGRILLKLIRSLDGFSSQYIVTANRNSPKSERLLTESSKHLILMGFSERQIERAILYVNRPSLEEILIVLSQPFEEINGDSEFFSQETPVVKGSFCLETQEIKNFARNIKEMVLLGFKNWEIMRKFNEKILFEIFDRVLKNDDEKETKDFFRKQMINMQENLVFYLYNTKLIVSDSKFLKKTLKYLHFYSRIVTKVVYFTKTCQFPLEFLSSNPFEFLKDFLPLIKVLTIKSSQYLAETLYKSFLFLNQQSDPSQIEFILKTLEFINKFSKEFPLTTAFLHNLLYLLLFSIRKKPENIVIFIKNQGFSLLKTLELPHKEKKSIDGVLFELFCEIIKVFLCNFEFLQKKFRFEISCYFAKREKEAVSLQKFLLDFTKYQQNSYFQCELPNICYIYTLKNKKSYITLVGKSNDFSSENLSYILSVLLEILIENFAFSIKNLGKKLSERAFSFIFLIKTLHILSKNFPMIISELLDYNIAEFLQKNGLFTVFSWLKRKYVSFLEFFIKGLSLFSFNNFNDFLIDIIKISFDFQPKSNRILSLTLINLYEAFPLINPLNFCENSQIHIISSLITLHMELIKLKKIKFHLNFLHFYTKILAGTPQIYYKPPYLNFFLTKLFQIISLLQMKKTIFLLQDEFSMEYEEDLSSKTKNSLKIQNTTPEILNKQDFFEIEQENHQLSEDFSEEIRFEKPFPRSSLSFFSKKFKIYLVFNEKNYPFFESSSKGLISFDNINKLKKTKFLEFSLYPCNKSEEIGFFYTKSTSKSSLFTIISFFFQEFELSHSFSLSENLELHFLNELFPKPEKLSRLELLLDSSLHKKRAHKYKRNHSDEGIIAYLNPNQAFQHNLFERDFSNESFSFENDYSSRFFERNGLRNNANIPELYSLELLRDCGFLYESNVKNEREDAQFSSSEEEFEEDSLENNNDKNEPITNEYLNSVEFEEMTRESQDFALFKKKILKEYKNFYQKKEIYKSFEREEVINVKEWICEEGNFQIFYEDFVIKVVTNFVLNESSGFKGFPFDFVKNFIGENTKITDDFICLLERVLEGECFILEGFLMKIYQNNSEVEDFIRKFIFNGRKIKRKALFLLKWSISNLDIFDLFTKDQKCNLLQFFAGLLSKNLEEFDKMLLFSTIESLIKEVLKEENGDFSIDKRFPDFFCENLLNLKIDQENFLQISSIITRIYESSSENSELILQKIEDLLSSEMKKLNFMFNCFKKANFSLEFEEIRKSSRKISILIDFLCEIYSVEHFSGKDEYFWVGFTDFLSISESISLGTLYMNPLVQALLPLIISFLRVFSQIERKDREFDEESGFFEEEIQKKYEFFEKDDDIFAFFLTKNKGLLNFILKKEDSFITKEISELILEKFPYLIDFDIKRRYFNEKLKKLKSSSLNGNSNISISSIIF